MNRWKCGSKSLPVADVTSSSVHQREPRNSTWSRVISRLRDPSLICVSTIFSECYLPLLMNSDAGMTFGEHGEITIGEGFREITSGWLAGLAAMARLGTRIIYDDVFLSGAESQAR